MVTEKTKSAEDYTSGQKEAAYSVLGEIVNLLAPFAEDVRIIGGWVPLLLYPDKDHFCLQHYPGGIRELAKEFLIYKDKPIITKTCRKLSEKFASAEHAGPVDIVSFMGIEDEEEAERVRQDAYQRVKYLIDSILS